MLKTACPMPYVRGSSVFSIQIPFSFQVLLLTMARAASLSFQGSCWCPTGIQKPACLLCARPKQLMCCKTFTSLQKEKQFSSFQPTAGKLCSKHSPSKRSLWELCQSHLSPALRQYPKHWSELSTTSLLKLLLLALINKRFTEPEEAAARKISFKLMLLVEKENPVFKSLFQRQFLHSWFSQNHRTSLRVAETFLHKYPDN